jgi:ABC-type transport system involved in Fe-S cluster assembly fused permease/ATPase subunit
MKGQINLEFILSVLVFLSVMSFITIQIINSVSEVRRDLAVEDIKSSAFQISNILMFDKGSPENWDATNVKRIGLKADFYSLDAGKVNSLNALCSGGNGYKKFVSIVNLGLSEDIYLNISTLSGKTLAFCAPPVESLVRSRAQSMRTAFIQGEGVVKIDTRVIL